MGALIDFLQGASNSAASTVTGPVDGLAWLLRKAGAPVGDAPAGGSAWAEQRGLMRPTQGTAGLLGEALGLSAPIVATAKAPQIAGGALRMGGNVLAPRTLGKQRGVMDVEFFKDPKAFRDISVENGRVVVKWPGFGESVGELRDRIRDAMFARFNPKYDHFFRFTNNADELGLIARGQLRASTNHLDRTIERGLSVADGPHYSIHGYRHVYPVRGNVVGKGSDGEPLLALDTLQPLTKKMLSPAAVVADDRARQLAILRNAGLPDDFLRGINLLNDPYSFKRN